MTAQKVGGSGTRTPGSRLREQEDQEFGPRAVVTQLRRERELAAEPLQDTGLPEAGKPRCQHGLPVPLRC